MFDSMTNLVQVFRTVFKFVDDFLCNTSQYGCPVPCTQNSYHYDLEYFSKHSWINPDKLDSWANDNFELELFFRYS